MRRIALLVRAAVALPCAGCSTSPSSAVDDPPSIASEEARTDLVCSEDTENVCEAKEPLSALTAACLIAVGVGFHIGCSRGLLNAYCPLGTEKVIYDTWDKTKYVTIDCDLLHDVVCGVGAVTAVELMRTACTPIP